MFQFMDMSSLQAALPNDQLSSSFLGGVSQSWFPPNSVTPYIPSAGQGRPVLSNGRAANLLISGSSELWLNSSWWHKTTKYLCILILLFLSFLVPMWCRWGNISGSASAKLSNTVSYFSYFTVLAFWSSVVVDIFTCCTTLFYWSDRLPVDLALLVHEP